MSKFKRIKYEPVTVLEPHKYEVMTFTDPDEFTQYYRENEDKFTNLSTLVLNRTYKIPGYRISIQNKGKENQELILKKDYYGGTVTPGTSQPTTLPINYLTQIQELTARVQNIEQFLEQLKI